MRMIDTPTWTDVTRVFVPRMVEPAQRGSVWSQDSLGNVLMDRVTPSIKGMTPGCLKMAAMSVFVVLLELFVLSKTKLPQDTSI